MSADQMRSYAETAAALDDWGAKWKALILEGLSRGMTIEDIAEDMGYPLIDVLTPLSRDPSAMAFTILEGDISTVDRAVRDMQAKNEDQGGAPQ
jgi:hypothetical protein